MEKLQIKIPLILPNVPDEKEGSVQKLINIRGSYLRWLSSCF